MPGQATLRVYDALARVITTLVDGNLSAGAHSATWRTKGFPTGVYFYKLTSSGLSATRKLVVLK